MKIWGGRLPNNNEWIQFDIDEDDLLDDSMEGFMVDIKASLQ